MALPLAVLLALYGRTPCSSPSRACGGPSSTPWRGWCPGWPSGRPGACCWPSPGAQRAGGGAEARRAPSSAAPWPTLAPPGGRLLHGRPAPALGAPRPGLPRGRGLAGRPRPAGGPLDGGRPARAVVRHRAERGGDAQRRPAGPPPRRGHLRRGLRPGAALLSAVPGPPLRRPGPPAGPGARGGRGAPAPLPRRSRAASGARPERSRPQTAMESVSPGGRAASSSAAVEPRRG